jgi:hypothetical protein
MLTPADHAAVNVMLAILMYFVIGQALAHPIHERMLRSARKRNRRTYPKALRIALSVGFGLTWPAVLIQILLDRRKERERRAKKDDDAGA